jgi:hypothetical protein
MVLIVPHAPLAQAPPPDSVAEQWFKANYASIRVTGPGGSRDTEAFTFEITPAMDWRIHSSRTERGKVRTGALMLVSDVLLTKDFPLEQGYEMDAFDGAALTLQLVESLLARAAGKAPSELHGRKVVNLNETATPIHVGTYTAEGDFPPPWRLRGYIESTSPGSVSFHLTFSLQDNDTGPRKLRYVGQWEQRVAPPELPDSLSLAGWQVFDVGPTRSNSAEGTVLDYGARRRESTYHTLGELRSAKRSAPQ